MMVKTSGPVEMHFVRYSENYAVFEGKQRGKLVRQYMPIATHRSVMFYRTIVEIEAHSSIVPSDFRVAQDDARESQRILREQYRHKFEADRERSIQYQKQMMISAERQIEQLELITSAIHDLRAVAEKCKVTPARKRATKK